MWLLYSDRTHKNCKACSTVAESLSKKKITFGNEKSKITVMQGLLNHCMSI